MSAAESMSDATENNSFIPRSDDDSTLWPVKEITKESATCYQVMWAGTSPATGKPWPQSWVPKSDCTNDLVAKWKAKMSSMTKTVHKSDSTCGSDGKARVVLTSKRKQRLDDAMVSTDGRGRPLEMGSTKPGKKCRQNPQASLYHFLPTPITYDPQASPGSSDHTRTTQSSVKVGPPTGVRKATKPSQPPSTPVSMAPLSSSEVLPQISPHSSDHTRPTQYTIKVGPPVGVRKAAKPPQPPSTQVSITPLSSPEVLPQISPCNLDHTYPTQSAIRVGPPVGVRKKQLSQAAEPQQSTPASTTPLTSPEVLRPSEIKHQSPDLSPSAHACLEVFDDVMAGLYRAKSPEALQLTRQQPEEQPGFSQVHCGPTETNATAPGIIEECPVLPDNQAPSPTRFLAKVEEIKRLQCNISIAANTALKLSLEVIEAANALGGRSQPSESAT